MMSRGAPGDGGERHKSCGQGAYSGYSGFMMVVSGTRVAGRALTAVTAVS